jgi:RHS repeat-associated protein
MLSFGSFSAASSTGTTVYFRWDGEVGFTVTGSSDDPESGIRHVTFPGLAPGWSGGGDDAISPYQARYEFGVDEPEEPVGPRNVTATNNAGLTSAPSAFTVTPDGAAPETRIRCNAVVCTDDWYGSAVTVSLNATDSESGVEVIKYTVDGTEPSGVDGTVYTEPFEVAEPSVVSFRAYDRVGNEEVAGSHYVRVDATPPSAPTLSFGSFAGVSATGSTVYFGPSAASGQFAVTATSSDPESGIDVDGYAFPDLGSSWTRTGAGATATYRHTGNPTDPPEPNEVRAQNTAGALSAPSSFAVTADGVAPTTSIHCGGAACSFDPYPGGVVVSLSATDAGAGVDEIRYTLNGSEPSRVNGSIYTAPFEVSGTTAVKFRAYDKVGNEELVGSRTVAVVSASPEAPPPLDPGASTSLYDATKFLYTGSNPIQRDVAPGAISLERIAVLRGHVRPEDPEPAPTGIEGVPGVKVSVLDHPEFGWTMTREDGHFDLAINGGGPVVVRYEKDGYLPVQRQVQTVWQEYGLLPAVVLTELDENVTSIEQGSSDPFQVARGSLEEDDDGTRRATLLVPAGASASMKLRSGASAALEGELNVRATEYTVGEAGDEAMPGTLPPNSGYTYAVEFSVDEALAAGATDVRFTKPLINYTENFIDAPVGSPVPTGYYDRELGKWVASSNGVVIEIVSEEGDPLRAGVDITGDGVADSEDALGNLVPPMVPAEREQLARLYDPGQQLWRVPIDHFTPWDHNWPFGPPPGARPPGLAEFLWKDPNDPCPEPANSFIVCEPQALGESLRLVGTPFSLDYRSNRVPGWKAQQRLDVPVTNSELPPGLKGVEVEVTIAGRKFVQRWEDPASQWVTEGIVPALAPNLSYAFEWDGRDAYGRQVQGQAVASVKLTYVYAPTYYEATDEFEQAFAQFGSGGESRFNGRVGCAVDFLFWRDPGPEPNWYKDWLRERYIEYGFCGIASSTTRQVSLGPWSAVGVDGLGSWTLDAHHAYDPAGQVLHYGDGTSVRADVIGATVETVAGGGSAAPETAEWARDAHLEFVDFDIAPDGSLFVLGFDLDERSKIYKIDPSGRISHYAGSGAFGDPDGDGGPARSARLGFPVGIAVAPDGSVYYVGTYVSRRGGEGFIRKIAPDQTITTVARTDGDPGTCFGTPTMAACMGDGRPVRDAKVIRPSGIDVAPDGNIYWTETGASSWKPRLRRIGVDGMVSTVAGGGTDRTLDEDLGPGEPGTQAAFYYPAGVAAAADGSVYVTDYDKRTVVRLGSDGMLKRFAGNRGPGDTGDGGAATAAEIENPGSVAVAPDGTVYIRTTSLGNSRIREIQTDGVIRAVTGKAITTASPDGELAVRMSRFHGMDADGGGLEVRPDGTLLLSHHLAQNGQRIRRIAPPLPTFSGNSIVLPSEDASELYEFDKSGRHLRTLDALTGSMRYRFTYDGARRLVAVTDGDGNETRIERAEDGTPLAIVAPGGQKTTLALDDGGYLRSVTNPAGEAVTMTYAAGGLLSTLRDAGGGLHRFAYDDAGRLVHDEGPDGEVKTLSRSETASTAAVTVRTALGRETVYSVEILSTGAWRRTIRQASGSTMTLLENDDGTQTRTAPDGTRTTVTPAPDPRWGMRAPFFEKHVVTSPAGLTRETTALREAVLRDSKDLLSLESLTDTVTVKGTAGAPDRTQTKTILAPSAVESRPSWLVEFRSALGRTRMTTLDTRGRVLTVKPHPGSAEMVIAYDARGRVASTSQGAQRLTYEYDAANRQTALTDASGGRIEYGYDAADRVVEQAFPGGRSYRYAYDAGGRMTTLTMPSGAVHEFTSTPGGKPNTYRPPGAPAAYDNDYDLDGAATTFTRPSGAVQRNTYDAGRKIGASWTEAGGATPALSDAFAYPGEGAEDRLSSTTRTVAGGPTQTRTFAYDGFLQTSLELAGAASGSFTFTYGDGDFLPDRERLELGDGTTLETALAHDEDELITSFGPFTFTRGGPAGALSKITDGALTVDYTYDALGRPRERTYAVNGHEFYDIELAYDNAGRITRKTEAVDGSAQTLAFRYDANGELTGVDRGGTAIESYAYDANGNRTTPSATYDVQDRLLTLGGVAYEHNADGFLTRRGSDTFRYSVSGPLLSATVGGASISYAYDAVGRRVTRTDASGTRQYLYGNPRNRFQVTAVRSPSGELTRLYYDETDVLFALQRGGARFYVGSDQVGTPRVVVDSSGTVVKKLEYDSFGAVVADSNPVFDLPLGFAGGLPDPVTKLVRFGVRDYDPAAGRWTAPDPAFFAGSPTNLYAYVGGNPISLRDPAGLEGGSVTGYYALGGGGSVSRGENGELITCLEGGVGGGVAASIHTGAPRRGWKVIAEISAGPATLGAELDLLCMRLTGMASLGAGPVSVGIDSDGGVSAGASTDFGLGALGKLALQRCW